MVPTVKQSLPGTSIEAALGAPAATFVDLRSPSEFAQDHVPGAVNVPLFDDDERALIGTLYAQRSPEVAFGEALAATRRRIGDLAREVGALAGWEVPPGDPVALVEALTAGGMRELESRLAAVQRGAVDGAVVLYCWRGQLRSKSVTAYLTLLGLERATLLVGGYKGYRKFVLELLAGWASPPAVVLRGWTGVGKTLVLRELERQRPGWTLDLELAAGHRSSILGMVGLQPVTQRRFDSRLAERIRAGFPGGVVVFEGESRKVGDAVQPERVWRALDQGENVRLATSLERRVAVLADDYLAHDASRAQLARQLPFIEARLGSTKYAGVLVGLLEAGRITELVELLLERYYDPLYAHSEKDRVYLAEFDATDPATCAREIADFIERRRSRLAGA
ncbi:MAG: tRNA 2-selenouridine(34) synthase MnmH [Planctomycetota bacterium]